MGQQASFNENAYVGSKLKEFEDVSKRMEQALTNVNNEAKQNQFWRDLLSRETVLTPALQEQFKELERKEILLAPKVQILNRLYGELNVLESEALETHRRYASDVALYRKHPTDIQKGHAQALRVNAQGIDNRLRSLVQTFRDTKRC